MHFLLALNRRENRAREGAIIAKKIKEEIEDTSGEKLLFFFSSLERTNRIVETTIHFFFFLHFILKREFIQDSSDNDRTFK